MCLFVSPSTWGVWSDEFWGDWPLDIPPIYCKANPESMHRGAHWGSFGPYLGDLSGELETHDFKESGDATDS